jgi:hypothetical protein
MAMLITIPEILAKVEKAESREDKIKLMQEYNCLALRDVLRGSFDSSITFILPEGTPPYRKQDVALGLTFSNLRKQTPKLRYFVQGGPGENLIPSKREKLFIEILESIHPTEAEVLIAMKDKQLKKLYPSLTKELVESAFPKLIVT